jgi:hypothetical protein
VWGDAALPPYDVYAVGDGHPGWELLHTSALLAPQWIDETQQLPDYNQTDSVLYGVHVSNGEVFVVGQGPFGPILHKSAAGWAKETNPVQWNLYSVWMVATNDVYAVGDNVILHSTGEGDWTAEWTVPVGSNTSLWGVWGGKEVFAVGENGTIMHRQIVLK